MTPPHLKLKPEPKRLKRRRLPRLKRLKRPRPPRRKKTVRPLTRRERAFREIKSFLRRLWLVRSLFYSAQALEAEFKNVFRRTPEAESCPAALRENDPESAKVFELSLSILKDIHAEFGGRLVVLHVAHEKPSAPPDACSPRLVQMRLAEAASENGFHLIQTHDALHTAPPSGGGAGHFPGGHLNETGHRTVAELLAPVLARALK